jgi:hypothetical protein
MGLMGTKRQRKGSTKRRQYISAYGSCCGFRSRAKIVEVLENLQQELKSDQKLAVVTGRPLIEGKIGDVRNYNHQDLSHHRKQSTDKKKAP